MCTLTYYHKEAAMHEHLIVETMNGAYCPTCGKFLKDIPKVKKTEKPPEKVKKKKVTKEAK